MMQITDMGKEAMFIDTLSLSIYTHVLLPTVSFQTDVEVVSMAGLKIGELHSSILLLYMKLSLCTPYLLFIIC